MNINTIWAFKKAIKATFWIFVFGLTLWQFALQKPVYQWIYGTPVQQTLTIEANDTFGMLPNAIPAGLIKGRDYAVQVDFLKSFHTTAKIVYIDRYNLIGTWYRSSRYGRNAKLYDWIVPLDVAWVNGPMNYPNLFKDYTFSHEYRVLFTEWQRPSRPFSTEHVNNNHIIPANKNVEKGLAILNVNDTAFIKGYLVNLQGLEQDYDFKLNSALAAGEVSNQLFGGQKGGKCRIIYVTHLIFDGYEFK